MSANNEEVIFELNTKDKNRKLCIDDVKCFALNNKNKFKVLHLIINSLYSKMCEIDLILQMKQYDIVFLNETKFDRYTSSSFYPNNYYDIIRTDRDFNDDQSGSKGGGIIIFVKKYYKVKFIKSLDVEFIYLNVRTKDKSINFISAYKSPKANNFQFLDTLEKFMLSIDLSLPLFIIGDLNLDLLKVNGKYTNSKGLQLQDFITNYNMSNFITVPTRSAIYKNKKNDTIRKSNTLIDVVIHNSDLLNKTDVI